MDSKTFIAAMLEARRRRLQRLEFSRFCSGGAIVLVGLILALLYRHIAA